jgi:hypothetical protein
VISHELEGGRSSLVAAPFGQSEGDVVGELVPDMVGECADQPVEGLVESALRQRASVCGDFEEAALAVAPLAGVVGVQQEPCPWHSVIGQIAEHAHPMQLTVNLPDRASVEA